MRGAQVRYGCAERVWAGAWVRGGGAWRRGWVSCVGRVPPCKGEGGWDWCAVGRVRGWVMRCLPVVPVVVWDTALILCGGRVIYGKVPNNTYSQGSQELIASAGAYRPGSLTYAQGPAVACPPRTPLCAPASYVPCINRKVALVVEN